MAEEQPGSGLVLSWQSGKSILSFLETSPLSPLPVFNWQGKVWDLGSQCVPLLEPYQDFQEWLHDPTQRLDPSPDITLIPSLTHNGIKILRT